MSISIIGLFNSPYQPQLLWSIKIIKKQDIAVLGNNGKKGRRTEDFF
jgi:hypothetical protein